MSKPRGTPFDDVFKTLVRDVPKILLFFLNEMFKGDIDEVYDGSEKVTPLDKEDIISLPSGDQQKRASDSRFKVHGKKGDKTFHIECQTNPDGSMALRMFEYDSQTALAGAKGAHEYNEEEIFLRFPHSGLLYLRYRENTPKSILTHLVTPKGSISYEIPIVRIGDYAVDDIISRKLYFLVPFYLFSYEGMLAQGKGGTSSGTREKIARDYGRLKDFLADSIRHGIIDSYELGAIARMNDKVMGNLTKDRNIRKEVAMVGKILNYKEKDILNRGRAEGIAEGRAEGIAEGGNLKLYELVQKGRLTLSEGADEMGVSEDDFVSRMSLCGYHLPKNEN